MGCSYAGDAMIDVARSRRTDPLISVVTVCFNAARTLRATLESVARQRGADFEFLVIDGASSDGTSEIIADHAATIDFFLSEPDFGIYDAWNKGLTHARGRYIAFLGADDIYLPGALDDYARFVNRHVGLEYVSSRVRYGNGPRARLIGKPHEWQRFRRYMTVAHVGSLHSRSLFDRIGSFDPTFRIAGDYDLLLRAGPDLKAGFMDSLTVEMGVGGVSSGGMGKVFSETLRAKIDNAAVAVPTAYYDSVVARAKWQVRELLKLRK